MCLNNIFTSNIIYQQNYVLQLPCWLHVSYDRTKFSLTVSWGRQWNKSASATAIMASLLCFALHHGHLFPTSSDWRKHGMWCRKENSIIILSSSFSQLSQNWKFSSEAKILYEATHRLYFMVSESHPTKKTQLRSVALTCLNILSLKQVFYI